MSKIVITVTVGKLVHLLKFLASFFFFLTVFYFIFIWLENHEGYIHMNHTITYDIH